MRGNVLVHGAMGVSRSVMMMCAYIMVKYDKPLATVLQHIRKQGRMVDPNEGFCRQLDRWFENGFAYTEKEAKEYGYWFGGSRTAAGDPQDELERQDEKDLKGKAKNVVQEDDQVIGEVFRPANITLAAAFRERSAAPGLASSPVYDSRIACTSSQQPTGSLRTTGSTCTVTSPKFHPKPAVRRTVAELIDIDCDYGHVWERHLARELKEYEIQSQKRRERERQETVRRRREQQARERFEGFWNSGGWDSEDERKHEVWRRAMEEHFPAEERREAEEKAATAVVMDRDAERVIIREDGRKLAAPARKKLRNVVPRTDGRNVAGPFRARLIPPREETVKVTPARIMSVQTTEAWETVSEDTRPMEPLECTENSIDGDFAGTRAVEAQDVERRVHREVERMLDEIVELTATTLETSNDAKITDVDVPPASLQEEEGTFASFPRQSEKAGQRTTSTDGPASRRPNGKVAAYFTGKSNKDTTNSPTPRETKCVESSMPEDPGSLQRAHALRRKRLTSGQLRAVSFTASASMIAVAQQGDGVGPELSAVINEPPAKATSTSKSDDSGSRGAAERITSLSRSPTSANCGMGMRGVVAYMR